MNRPTPLLCVVGGLSILAAAVFAVPASLAADDSRADAAAADDQATIERLRAELMAEKRENAKLRTEVKALSARIAELQQRRVVTRVRPGPQPTRPAIPGDRSQPPALSPPRGWVEREFNGIKFYLVPLEDDAGGK